MSMPRTPKSPQDKKRLSLKKDRRNTYGENAKSSRRNIARNKAFSHQKVRAKARRDVKAIDPDREIEADTLQSTLTTAKAQKGRWQKSPDTPLGQVVPNKLPRRQETVGAKKRRRERQS